MTTNGTHNVLVYRSNGSWRALEGELMDYATGCYKEGSWVRADGVTVKIFPEGTSESEIGQWVLSEAATLESAQAVYCDATTRFITQKLDLPRWYRFAVLDYLFSRAFDDISRNASPAEVYRKIFMLLATTAGVRRVQIVLDNLADYNPLMLEGFEQFGHSDSQLVRYAEEFRKLIPPSVTVEFIAIAKLTLPDEHAVALVHHHALNTTRNPTGIRSGEHRRLLMPYPKGFIQNAALLCDISSVVRGDILEGVRELLESHK